MMQRKNPSKSLKLRTKTTKSRLSWFSTRQAAEFLGLDVPTITRLLDNQILPWTVLPGSIRWRRIHRRDLTAYQRQIDAQKGNGR